MKNKQTSPHVQWRLRGSRGGLHITAKSGSRILVFISIYRLGPWIQRTRISLNICYGKKTRLSECNAIYNPKQTGRGIVHRRSFSDRAFMKSKPLSGVGSSGLLTPAPCVAELNFCPDRGFHEAWRKVLAHFTKRLQALPEFLGQIKASAWAPGDPDNRTEAKDITHTHTQLCECVQYVCLRVVLEREHPSVWVLMMLVLIKRDILIKDRFTSVAV